jgi:hypothetical protein
MLTRARLWLRSIVLRRRLEREMQEEMAEHLDRSTARLVARGLAPHDARREALREFGPVAFLQERAREARGGRWAEEVVADLRFGRRHLARAPLTTLVMFVVLARDRDQRAALLRRALDRDGAARGARARGGPGAHPWRPGARRAALPHATRGRGARLPHARRPFAAVVGWTRSARRWS